MQSITALEELLEEQFGPFIRDNRYKKAFEQAMQSLKGMNTTSSRIDIFYLFLHHLVIELFDEIDRISAQLHSNNKEDE